jgi:hypothetical protein
MVNRFIFAPNPFYSLHVRAGGRICQRIDGDAPTADYRKTKGFLLTFYLEHGIIIVLFAPESSQKTDLIRKMGYKKGYSKASHDRNCLSVK